jgi:hypothetical protein
MLPHYAVAQCPNPPAPNADWDSPLWPTTPPLTIESFRIESSSHRPTTQLKLCHSPDAIHGIFRVDDRFVRCIHSGINSPVYKDSCVECFLHPPTASGYFNFEFNCGGAVLASFIRNPTRIPGGFEDFELLQPEHCQLITRIPSLPQRIEPEIEEALSWTLAFTIPLAVLEHYAGPLGRLSGKRWRANFYKCADGCSHPHWGAWSAVDALNFHLPHCFGTLNFE